AAVSFWGVAFTSGLWLAFAAGLGAVGVWIGLSTGLIVYAALLLWRFQLLTRRGYLPAGPGASAPAPGAPPAAGLLGWPARIAPPRGSSPGRAPHARPRPT